MRSRVRVLVIGVAPAFLLFCGLSTLLPRSTSPLTSQPQVTTGPSVERRSDSSTPASSSAVLSAMLVGLPVQFEELDEFLPEWVKLEAAIIRGSDAVRERLLERYASESDPAYKGALAVLMSSDPTVHERIRDDLGLPRGERLDLFHGLALYALLRTPPASPEAALSESNTKLWQDLFKFARLAGYQIDARLEYKQTGVYEKAISCAESMMQLDRSRTLTEAVSPVTSADMRARLIAAYESDWDWDWVCWLSRKALAKTSETFPEFAVRLAETYLTSSSWDRAEIGFDLLGDASLPESSFILLDRWARASVGEYHEFDKVVDLVAHQEHSSADQLLLDLHAMTATNSSTRGSVMEAMIESGSATFRPLAQRELTSARVGDRIVALCLFSRMGGDESWKQIQEQAVNDGNPRVRYAALVYLLRREPREEIAVQTAKRAAESDPDPRVRNLAQEMLTKNEQPWLMSNWDWGSYSRSMNLDDTD